MGGSGFILVASILFFFRKALTTITYPLLRFAWFYFISFVYYFPIFFGVFVCVCVLSKINNLLLIQFHVSLNPRKKKTIFLYFFSYSVQFSSSCICFFYDFLYIKAEREKLFSSRILLFSVCLCVYVSGTYMYKISIKKMKIRSEFVRWNGMKNTTKCYKKVLVNKTAKIIYQYVYYHNVWGFGK